MERFIFEESCRLKQAALLLARAREFLKERHILLPAEAALLRLVGEQKRRARERIAAKLTGSLSSGVVKALICTRTPAHWALAKGPLPPPRTPPAIRRGEQDARHSRMWFGSSPTTCIAPS